jgi:hypothetical protein
MHGPRIAAHHVMTPPKIEFRVPLHPLASLFGDAHAHVMGVHPLSDGSVVLHLSTRAEPIGDARIRLVVADGRGLRPLAVPEEVAACVEACGEDPVTEEASYGAPVSFRLGDRVGLLVADRWAWVFDPLGGTAPVAIAIEPLALVTDRWGSRSYVPDRCGAGRDGRIPVIFRQPHAKPGYACYLSALEIDLGSGRGRWTSQGPAGDPVVVPYRLNPGGFNGVPEYAGTTLGDALWLGDRFRLFTMGNVPYGRMTMPYVTVLESDADGGNPRAVREIDESAHALFAADGRHMLLLPFTRRGPRKGKPSLIDLEAGTEMPLSVRGLAGYMPMAHADGRVWMAGGGRPGSWSRWDQLSLRDSDGDHGELVACRVE